MLLALVTACMPSLASFDDTAFVCTEEAVASVQVLVGGPGHQPVESADITFDSADDSDVPCEEVGDGAYVCGWEVAGVVDIRVEAEGYSAKDFSTFVTADACHVETAVVEVVLEPVECGTEGAAVVVRVYDGAGDGYLQEAEVDWTTGDEQAPCDGSGVYACWSPAGDIDIVVVAEGYETERLGVFVDEDECGPETQLLEITMEPSRTEPEIGADEEMPSGD